MYKGRVGPGATTAQLHPSLPRAAAPFAAAAAAAARRTPAAPEQRRACCARGVSSSAAAAAAAAGAAAVAAAPAATPNPPQRPRRQTVRALQARCVPAQRHSRQKAAAAARWASPQEASKEVCSCLHLKCAGIWYWGLRFTRDYCVVHAPYMVLCTRAKSPAHLRWVQEQTSQCSFEYIRSRARQHCRGGGRARGISGPLPMDMATKSTS